MEKAFNNTINHFGPERSDRINSLASVINAKSYLEIGVYKGETFFKIKVDKKTGVDPEFHFDFSKCSSDVNEFYLLTSDEFFMNKILSNIKYDIIFLDGFHERSQTFKDFCTSIKFSNAKTIWVIDDSCPSSYFASISPRLAKLTRMLIRSKDSRWMGDVYKAIIDIRYNFPQYQIATFDLLESDNGVTQSVIWSRTKPFKSGEKNDFRKKRNYILFNKQVDSILNFKTSSEIIAEISSTVL